MPHRRSISGGASSSAPCAVITRESRIAGDNTPMWGDAEARPTASPAHPIMSRSWKPTLWRPSRLWKGSTNAADKEACTTGSLARHHAPKSGDNAPRRQTWRHTPRHPQLGTARRDRENQHRCSLAPWEEEHHQTVATAAATLDSMQETSDPATEGSKLPHWSLVSPKME